MSRSLWKDPRARVELSTLREALSHRISGVAIVTTNSPLGNVGILVSSFTSVSFDPPSVLVCINASSRAYPAIQAAGCYAVNILGGSQAWLASRFSAPGLSSEERFTGLELHTSLTGSPLIDGSVAWMDCVVKQEHRVGTHSIVVAEVIAAGVDPGEEAPLAYYRRSLEPVHAW